MPGKRSVSLYLLTACTGENGRRRGWRRQETRLATWRKAGPRKNHQLSHSSQVSPPRAALSLPLPNAPLRTQTPVRLGGGGAFGNREVGLGQWARYTMPSTGARVNCGSLHAAPQNWDYEQRQTIATNFASLLAPVFSPRVRPKHATPRHAPTMPAPHKQVKHVGVLPATLFDATSAHLKQFGPPQYGMDLFAAGEARYGNTSLGSSLPTSREVPRRATTKARARTPKTRACGAHLPSSAWFIYT